LGLGHQCEEVDDQVQDNGLRSLSKKQLHEGYLEGKELEFKRRHASKTEPWKFPMGMMTDINKRT